MLRPSASTAVARTTYCLPVERVQRLCQVVDVASSSPPTVTPPLRAVTEVRVPSRTVTVMPLCGFAWRAPFPGVILMCAAESVGLGLGLGEAAVPEEDAAQALATKARASADSTAAPRRVPRRPRRARGVSPSGR